MVRVLDEPQLRYTSDTQTEVTEMMVEFSGLLEDDPPSRLKVVGWRNLALQIKEQYVPGDRLIIQGSLRMNTFERQEGFKEKRAELTASRIEKIGQGDISLSGSAKSNSPSSNVVSMESYKPLVPEMESQEMAKLSRPQTPEVETAKVNSSETEKIEEDPNFDDIPF